MCCVEIIRWPENGTWRSLSSDAAMKLSTSYRYVPSIEVGLIRFQDSGWAERHHRHGASIVQRDPEWAARVPRFHVSARLVLGKVKASGWISLFRGSALTENATELSSRIRCEDISLSYEVVISQQVPIVIAIGSSRECRLHRFPDRYLCIVAKPRAA